MKVRGRQLRCVLTLILMQAGRPLSIDELATALTTAGFDVDGRASKTISDALRRRSSRGRAVKLTRALYATGEIPTSTRCWIRSQVREMQRAAQAIDRRDPAASRTGGWVDARSR